MSKLNWNIVHECDDEDGNPAQWSSEINHPKYGKYCRINDMGDCFGVEVDYHDQRKTPVDDVACGM